MRTSERHVDAQGQKKAEHGGAWQCCCYPALGAVMCCAFLKMIVPSLLPPGFPGPCMTMHDHA